MGIWEIIYCFFAALGMFALAGAVLARIFRPGEAGLWVTVDLDRIPEARWSRCLTFCHWLWDFGLLPGRLRVRLPEHMPRELKGRLSAWPFVEFLER